MNVKGMLISSDINRTMFNKTIDENTKAVENKIFGKGCFC